MGHVECFSGGDGAFKKTELNVGRKRQSKKREVVTLSNTTAPLHNTRNPNNVRRFTLLNVKERGSLSES